MASARSATWRWVLPVAGLVVGGVGGGIATLTSDMSRPVAVTGAAAAAMAGIVAGLVITSAQDRRSAAEAREQAVSRREAAGDSLP
jgi:hypothetical protein